MKKKDSVDFWGIPVEFGSVRGNTKYRRNKICLGSLSRVLSCNIYYSLYIALQPNPDLRPRSKPTLELHSRAVKVFFLGFKEDLIYLFQTYPVFSLHWLGRRLWDRGLSPLVLGNSNCWRGSNKYSGQLTLSIYSTAGLVCIEVVNLVKWLPSHSQNVSIEMR